MNTKLRTNPSLLLRLTLWVAAIAIASVAASILTLYLEFEAGYFDAEERSLFAQARELTETVISEPQPQLKLNALQQRLYGPQGSYGYTLWNSNGELLLRSPRLAMDLTTLPPFLFDDHDFIVSVDQDTGERLLGIAFVVPDTAMILMASRPLLDASSVLSSFLLVSLDELGWLYLILLIAVVAVIVLVLNFSLRPLRQISKEAGLIGVERLDLRLQEQGVPREIQPLVSAMNQALERVERGFRAQQEFTASAAHELRTPLAVLKIQLEELLPGEHSAPLRADIDQLSRIVEQLLQLARVEARGVHELHPLEPVAIARQVAGDLAPLILASGRELDFQVTECPWQVSGDRTLLGLVVRNLLENALRHTPTGTEIRISARPGELRVEDSGPGIPQALREKIFQRFWRAHREHGDGAGLGLALVRRIAELHRASIRVEDSPLGGASMVLCFSRYQL